MNYNILCAGCRQRVENNEATTKKGPFLEHTDANVCINQLVALLARVTAGGDATVAIAKEVETQVVILRVAFTMMLAHDREHALAAPEKARTVKEPYEYAPSFIDTAPARDEMHHEGCFVEIGHHACAIRRTEDLRAALASMTTERDAAIARAEAAEALIVTLRKVLVEAEAQDADADGDKAAIIFDAPDRRVVVYVDGAGRCTIQRVDDCVVDGGNLGDALAWAIGSAK